MPDPNLLRLVKKNYLLAIQGVLGANLFKSIWVLDKTTHRTFDALENGDGACAYVVSGVLYLHGLIDSPHATVATTVAKMLEHGWRKTNSPTHGDIVQWPAHNDHMHIGFYINENECISNSSIHGGVPTKHSLQLKDGRLPMAYYTHNIVHGPEPH